MSWRIKFYETASGQEPVRKFILSLQSSTKAKFLRQFDLLEELGPELGMPNAKPIGDGLFELRVRGKEEVRSLYIFQEGDVIFILHAFKKKAMSIQKKDLKIALERKKEIRNLTD